MPQNLEEFKNKINQVKNPSIYNTTTKDALSELLAFINRDDFLIGAHIHEYQFQLRLAAEYDLNTALSFDDQPEGSNARQLFLASQELMFRKRLAQVFSVEGKTTLQNENFDMDGGILREHLTSFQKSFESSPLSDQYPVFQKVAMDMEDAIVSSEGTKYTDPVKRKEERGLFIPVSSEYHTPWISPKEAENSGHQEACVIYKDKLIWINRGQGAGHQSGLTVFKINNPENLKDELDYHIGRTVSSDELTNSTKSNSLRKKLGLEEIAYVPMRRQQIGNCTFATSKGMVLTSLIINVMKEQNIGWDEAVPQAKKLYKAFTEHYRKKIVTEYCEFHKKQPATPFDYRLLSWVYHKLFVRGYQDELKLLMSFPRMEENLASNFLWTEFRESHQKMTLVEMVEETEKLRRKQFTVFDGSLLHSIERSDRELFDDILQNTAVDIHQPYFWGETALHTAAGKQDPYYYNQLIKMGANPKAMMANGKTPEDILQATQRKQQLLFLSKLYRNHQDKPKTRTYSGIFLACEQGDLVALKHQLIEENEDPNLLYVSKYDGCFWTPLLSAVDGGDLAVVKCLLENGAKESINHQYYNGETALHLATSKGNFEIVQLLVENGANIELTKDSKTALQIADEANQFHIKKYLHGQQVLLDADKLLSRVIAWKA